MNLKLFSDDIRLTTGLSAAAQHSRLKYRNISPSKEGKRIYLSPDQAALFFDIQWKKQTLAFQVVKGGTGKTSLALHTGVGAALLGARVLFIDIDQQANLTSTLGVDVRKHDTPLLVDILEDLTREEVDTPLSAGIINVAPNIDLLPSSIENAQLDHIFQMGQLSLDRTIKKLLAPIKQNYDLIIFDCPPALGNVMGSVALAADKIVCPVNPEAYSTEGLMLNLKTFNRLSKNYDHSFDIKVILNKVSRATYLSKDTLELVKTNELLKGLVLRNTIRVSQEIPNMISQKETLFSLPKYSQAKEEMFRFISELLELEKYLKFDTRSELPAEREYVV